MKVSRRQGGSWKRSMGLFDLVFIYQGSSIRDSFECLKADLLAMELMMPEEFILEEIKGKKYISDEIIKKLAYKFKVSESVMTMRLVRMGMR